MKICSKCKIQRIATNFYKDKSKSDGLTSYCKPCSKTLYKPNNDYQKQYRATNYDKRISWDVNNADKVRQHRKTYRQNNLETIRQRERLNSPVNTAKRRAAKLNATPNWLDKSHQIAFKSIYKQAKLEGKHVDHVIPLQSEFVCGLHVPWNLQLLDPIENIKKSNKLYL